MPPFAGPEIAHSPITAVFPEQPLQHKRHVITCFPRIGRIIPHKTYKVNRITMIFFDGHRGPRLRGRSAAPSQVSYDPAAGRIPGHRGTGGSTEPPPFVHNGGKREREGAIFRCFSRKSPSFLTEMQDHGKILANLALNRGAGIISTPEERTGVREGKGKPAEGPRCA